MKIIYALILLPLTMIQCSMDNENQSNTSNFSQFTFREIANPNRLSSTEEGNYFIIESSTDVQINTLDIKDITISVQNTVCEIHTFYEERIPGHQSRWFVGTNDTKISKGEISITINYEEKIHLAQEINRR